MVKETKATLMMGWEQDLDYVQLDIPLIFVKFKFLSPPQWVAAVWGFASEKHLWNQEWSASA